MPTTPTIPSSIGPEAAIAPSAPVKQRPPMVKAELLGRHTHVVTNGGLGGCRINVYRRGQSYLARGYYNRSRFGETLGHTEQEAELRLHETIHEIRQGSYVRRSEAKNRPLARPSFQRLSVRALVDEFLFAKQKKLGAATTGDYRARLTPLVEFSELPSSRKKWPTAMSVDDNFAAEFRGELTTRRVTRNGHSAAATKIISVRQVHNVLDAARTAFNWGKDVRVAKLPSYFINPFNEEVVGQRPRKDPLRQPPFPLLCRVELVTHMDVWQLAHLTLSLILPVRPEDCTALMIGDIDFENRLIHFGTRFEGRDFNKGRVSFTCPYPEQFDLVVRHCRGARIAGPLLLARSIYEGRRRPQLIVGSGDDVERAIQTAIERSPTDLRRTLQDQKKIVRRTIRQMGGVTGDELAKEFKTALGRSSTTGTGRFYDLRSAVTTELNRSGVSHLAQTYVTGHTTKDILGEYVALDLLSELKKYFDYVTPLLDAINERARKFRMS